MCQRVGLSFVVNFKSKTMKKHILYLSVMVLILSIACNAAKDTTSRPVNQETAQEGNNETKDMSMTDDNQETQGGYGDTNAIQGANGSTGGNMNINTDTMTDSWRSGLNSSQMYADLNMTDEQIRSFEMAMTAFQEKQKSTANGEMLGTLESERDRQLENILTTEQFHKYEEWKANN